MKGKPSLLGMISGAVAGLVAVTPASGFAGPMGSLVLGLAVGRSACSSSIYGEEASSAMTTRSTCSACIASAASSARSATGILVAPWLGGVGLTDYTNFARTRRAGDYDMLAQVIIQAKAVGFTLLWSGVGSSILYKLVDLVIVGLRPEPDEEREGLDIADHGERAYNP